jgi:pimeloyl-ACP methyl ester carboxylesterase
MISPAILTIFADYMKMNLSQRLAIAYYKTKIHTIGLVSASKAAEIAYELFCTPRKPRKKLKEPPLFHKAEKLHLLVKESTLKGFRFTPQQPNGNKILILHGFSSYSYKFEKYVSLFKKQGFEVVAFDAPAHGLSEGKIINALIYKEAILQIEANFGPFYGLMGHSLGGLAGALAFQEFNDQANRRLVMVAPAVRTQRAIEHFYSLLPVDEKIRVAIDQLFKEITHLTIEEISVNHAIKHIQSPILWIHDKNDNICIFDDVLPIMNEKPEHIRFVITEGLGHSRIYKEASISNTIDHFFREGLD